MSSVYMVTDAEIASLFYLNDDRKIAGYLGIDVSRVARVRRSRRKPIEHKPFVAVTPLPEPSPEPAIGLPEPIEEELAQEPLSRESILTPCLCPTCGAPVSGRLTVVHIQALVAAYYQIPVRDMASDRKHRAVCRPRQIAMYLAYETTPKSLPDIGRRFGGRDHTTVLHAVKVVQRLMLSDPEIDADVCALRERLAA